MVHPFDFIRAMIQDNQSMASAPPAEGKRESLFIIAYKFFPRSFLVTSIGATFTISLYIYNYLRDQGIESIVSRVCLTAFIVGAVPTISLYLITLARAPRIRRREEKEAAHKRNIAHGDLEALQAREEKA